MLLDSLRSVKSLLFLASDIVHHDKADDHKQNNRENKNKNPGLIFCLLVFLLIPDNFCSLLLFGMDFVWVLEAGHCGSSIFLLRLWVVVDRVCVVLLLADDGGKVGFTNSDLDIVLLVGVKWRHIVDDVLAPQEAATDIPSVLVGAL